MDADGAPIDESGAPEAIDHGISGAVTTTVSSIVIANSLLSSNRSLQSWFVSKIARVWLQAIISARKDVISVAIKAFVDLFTR